MTKVKKSNLKISKLYKIPNQQALWDNIASEWNDYRQTPIPEVLNFLKDKKETNEKKQKILDMGAGSGRHLIKNPRAEYYLVDFSPEMIKLASKKASKIKQETFFFISELHKLPFKNKFFDTIIFIDSLHCLNKEDRAKALKELKRLLSPKGQAFISVWNKESPRFKNSGKEKLISWKDKGQRYYYLYDEEELIKELSKTGFKIKRNLTNKDKIMLIISN